MRNGNASFRIDNLPGYQNRRSGDLYVSLDALLVALMEYRNDFYRLNQPQHAATLDPIITVLKAHR